MAQTTISFELDEKLKNDMEKVCEDMGMSIAVAFTIFAKKVGREHKMPFEVAADPFYSEANMARLREAINDAKEGRNMTEHELIEVDDD